MKLEEDPLVSVSIKMTNMDEANETVKEEREVPLDLYNGDSLFDAVYRFCVKHKISIYDYGRQLEELVLETFQNASTQINITDLQQPSEQQVAGLTTEQQLSGSSSDQAAVLSISSDQNGEVNVSAPEVNNTRFKLFTLPVKVNNKNVELDFYNGDKLNEKITGFCETHGLNETIAKQPLIDAVMNYSKAVQDKFPNSLWFESL